MVKLRAEEHRYLVTADGADEPLVRRIPGCRHVAAAQALQLPRQPGSVIALDRLFGEQGWEHSADLALEVAETRGRQHAPPEREATVSLVGNELSVECAFGDKELVKLVPGYRWSAPQRRWYLPGSPMALELLREYFGAKLVVDDTVAEYLELRRRDEQARVERAQAAAVVRREPEPAVEIPGLAEPAEEPPPAKETSIEERLDRLASAVEDLVAVLRGGLVPVLAPEPTPPTVTTDLVTEPPETEADWRELLSGLDADAPGTRDRANRLAQTARPEHEPVFRVIAGLALARLGDHQEALTALRRGLEQPGVVDEDLAREASAAYQGVVLTLVSARCGASEPITSTESFKRLLHAELVNDLGFDDGALGSPDAQKLLDYLVNDPVLRRIAPELSDYARVAHLLGVARGSEWMAATRIVDILREHTLGADPFALSLILLANAVYEQASLNDWHQAWPREDVHETLRDLGWLVALAEGRLRETGIDPALVESASLAALACIAGGPMEWATLQQRKSLVQLVPLRSGQRREYAEFLAAYRPAAEGQKSAATQFPGWVKVLAQMRLSRSAAYLMDVATNDNGGSGSLTWALAESVYLQALGVWGIDDAQTQLVDLLDLLEAGRRPDNYLNELGRLVELPSRELAWTARVSRDQRKTLYRRALDVSLKQGHDKDSLEAFDRLVRELRDEGEPGNEEVMATCVRLSTGMRAVRGPALEVLLGMQLETGLPFEQTALQLIANQDYDGAALALAGMFHLFPRFREWWEANKPSEVELARTSDSVGNRRVLVVGGHKWLEQRVKPVLEGEWGLDLAWQDADEALRGDLAKARNADLVVINTACIGHAASGRIGEAARAAGVTIVPNHSRGAGSMLARMAVELAKLPATA